MPCFYLTPKQDDFNQIPELQVCLAEVLYDVGSIRADPGAYCGQMTEFREHHSTRISANLRAAYGDLFHRSDVFKRVFL